MPMQINDKRIIGAATWKGGDNPKLVQIPRISVPIDSGRKDCPFDIDHLSYTINEKSKTCTIRGLK